MKFRTEIKLESQQQNVLDYSSKILLLGSCFSENIGAKLAYYKFNTLVNPFGTLFSPLAIAQVLKDTVANTIITEDTLVQQSGLYHSLHHSSKLSSTSAAEVIENVTTAQQTCLAYITKASHIVITLGTSWVYKHIKTNSYVANCHKVPQVAFQKKMLSVLEVEKALQSIVTSIKSVNKKAQIIFTVSPVRHTKEGLVENSLSKAGLLSAVSSFLNTANVFYFGSYEIMLDDLRDYRFYEADMIHPNTVAISYIWEKFGDVWISDKAQQYFKRIASVQQSLLHKPFHQNSEAYQEFLNKLHSKKLALENELHVKF